MRMQNKSQHYLRSTTIDNIEFEQISFVSQNKSFSKAMFRAGLQSYQARNKTTTDPRESINHFGFGLKDVSKRMLRWAIDPAHSHGQCDIGKGVECDLHKSLNLSHSSSFLARATLKDSDFGSPASLSPTSSSGSLRSMHCDTIILKWTSIVLRPKEPNQRAECMLFTIYTHIRLSVLSTAGFHYAAIGEDNIFSEIRPKRTFHTNMGETRVS